MYFYHFEGDKYFLLIIVKKQLCWANTNYIIVRIPRLSLHFS